MRAAREIDALVQPGQLEPVLDAEVFEHVVGRKVVDAEQHLAGHRPELGRQRGERRLGQRREVVQRGRRLVSPDANGHLSGVIRRE